MPNQGGKQFEQAYNCQAAVDANGGSRLIVGACVSQHSNDKQESVPTLQSIPQALGRPESVSADSGYFTSEAVAQVEKTEDGQATGITVYAAVERQQHGRTAEQLEARAQPTPPLAGAPMSEVLRYRLQSSTGKAIYKLRRETVEPIFGIIKEVLGFRRFRLRGIEKAKLEWKLVSLEYNLKRLHTLTAH